ncbi:MAG: beta-ketoacyl synthase N-terminal-like domain-containing protein [Bacillota bacterium]
MNSSYVNIIGTSMLNSLGIGNSAVWEGMLKGSARAGHRTYSLYDGTTIDYPVYAMPDLELSDWVPNSTYRWLVQEGLHKDKDFLFMLVAIKMAIEDAGLQDSDLAKVALVIGHENLGINRMVDKMLTNSHSRSNNEERYPDDPLASFQHFKNDFFRLQSFPYLFYLSKAIGVKGLTYTINNACASGLYSLEMARQIIRSGQADTVITVCADYAHATEYLWLGDKGFHSQQNILRPFDSSRDGSILGDGAASIILQSPDLSTEYKSIGRYLGGSFRQDSWQLSLPDVLSHSYGFVIKDAISRLVKNQIDLLIPHGTGMKLWDSYEANEIKYAFDQLELPLPDMTAFKGYFGHTLGANSLLETVCLLECMKHQIIAPTANYGHNDLKSDFPIIKKWTHKKIDTAVKVVSAYGGFQAASIFEVE